MRAKYTRYLWYGAGCIVILMMAWIVASPSTKHSIVRKIEEFTHPSRHTIITPDNQIIHVNRAERSENIHTTYQKALLPLCPPVAEAYFSPYDSLGSLLVELIKHERESIRIAIFSFTDGTIAQALIEAQERGVTVEIMADAGGIKDRFSKINMLALQGVPVYVYIPTNQGILNDILHHKFALFGCNLFDSSLIWTGSFNFTKSASKANHENVVLLDTKPLIARYSEHYKTLRKRTRKYKPVKMPDDVTTIAQRKKKVKAKTVPGYA